jgi:precorrin-2/cobalt-factor-2 C20-methyltransferase
MIGRLYVVGVGPGDPELLTLKAVRILGCVGSICVPRGTEGGESLALSIIQRAVSLDGKEIIEAYFPMKKTAGRSDRAELDAQWSETISSILDRLRRGIDTAFITIGDPGLYSTFFYLYERLIDECPGLQVEIVPGVSSINASAARAGIGLASGDERIAILPANYVSDLTSIFQRFDTVVLMKVYRVLAEVRASLADLGLLDKAVYVSRAGMADEMVSADLNSLNSDELDYFSLIIVRKQGTRGTK